MTEKTILTWAPSSRSQEAHKRGMALYWTTNKLANVGLQAWLQSCLQTLPRVLHVVLALENSPAQPRNHLKPELACRKVSQQSIA